MKRFARALQRMRDWKPVRVTARFVRKLTYWRSRRDHRYYVEVVRQCGLVAPQGGSVIDIGAHETHVLGELKGFARRVALDRAAISSKPGVETVRANFLKYVPNQAFDLVLCLQVLEHLKDPETFAKKLFETGRNVIISVPYKWPRGKCRWHVQDPVDEEKLAAWTGRVPTTTIVAKDKSERLIAVYVGGGEIADRSGSTP